MSNYTRKTNRTWKIAAFLTVFPYTGLFGVHEYYLGNIGIGILKTFTANFFAFGWFYDIYKIFTDQYYMSNGKCLKRYIKVNSNPDIDNTIIKTTSKPTAPPKSTEKENNNKTPVATNNATEPSDKAKSMFIRIDDTNNHLVVIPNYGEERPKTEHNSYVDFENGVIYKKWGDAPTDILGYYDTAPVLDSNRNVYRVFDPSKKQVLAKLADEMIYFIRTEEQSRYKFMPDEVCLAYYSEKSGSIKPEVGRLKCFGLSQWALTESVGFTQNCRSLEDAIGGAAAFVAYMYNFNFHCIFSDFFVMGYEEFDKKYPEETSF